MNDHAEEHVVLDPKSPDTVIDTGDRVEVFADDSGEWRWRRIAKNGDIVSVSGEGYVHEYHALWMAGTRNSDIPAERVKVIGK